MQFIILSLFAYKTFYNLLAFAYYLVEPLSERFELCTTGRNHVTSVRNLHHIGASTHPGPGLGGVSGFNVAKALGA